MSIPNKIMWLLGYNNLGFILEQERQHWLLKTDKKKQIQDKVTGDMFSGEIDNIGSNILLTTEKLPYKNDMLTDITYTTSGISRILDLQASAFTYSSGVNGLSFARILSSSYPVTVNNELKYKNYKLQLTNCTKCIIPFAGSFNSSNVFSGEWVKTSTPPRILMMDDNGEYTISESLAFTGATNCVWYYPLTETLQPLRLINDSGTTWSTAPVNNDGMIGYPLYWFTCSETNVGPTLYMYSNQNSRKEQYFFIANEGNVSKYRAKVYTGLSGDDNATPDLTSTSDYEIRVSPATGYQFYNNINDFSIKLDEEVVVLYNTTTEVSTTVQMGLSEPTSKMVMSNHESWTYVNPTMYSIPLDVFDINSFKNFPDSPLVSVFDVFFDESVPFSSTTNDYSYTGIQMSASNLSSDVYPNYPYDLTKWDGIPERLNDNDNVPQHLCVYAIHNTPIYDGVDPSTRQTAALLFDPGKEMTEESGSEMSNDEKGRVYMLSNDDAVYENNSTLEFAKPARTIARICDIPTSVVQLSGISGIAPTNVVDKKYVRSDVDFNTNDKNLLYNMKIEKWVKPTHLTKEGTSVVSANGQETNNFVFLTLEGLNSVDLINHNDFREYINLNPMVDPSDVSVGTIQSGGAGYSVGDIGVIIVGGFAFNYTVDSLVDETSSINTLTLSPADADLMINLSNFDIADGDISGYTEPYGSSPITGNGTGLKLRFLIDGLSSIITKKSEITNGLYALYRDKEGLWLYEYVINNASSTVPKTGTWTLSSNISYDPQSSYNTKEGLTLTDSYMSLNIPLLHDIEIFKSNENKTISEFETIKAFTTSSFVNIVDNKHIPFKDDKKDDDIIQVDITGYTSHYVGYCNAARHNQNAAIEAIRKSTMIDDDCYVFWRWNATNTEQTYLNCLNIVYVVCRHKFANLMTTDTTTLLPKNNLRYQKYVNSNSSTTISWSNEKVGTMVWMYNNESQYNEQYKINENGELGVDRTKYNWNDFAFPYDEDETLPDVDLPRIISAEGLMNWNVATNKRLQAIMPQNEEVYQQPELINIVSFGDNPEDANVVKPVGQWQLVLPRIETFKLSNGSKSVTPVKLTALQGNSIGNPGMITDIYENDIRNKVMVIDSSSKGISLQLFNSEINRWEEL